MEKLEKESCNTPIIKDGSTAKCVNPQKVDETKLLNEAERIKAYYKDCFILGYDSKKGMKFLHFAGKGFEIRTGVNIKKILLLDSNKKDYKEYIKTISEGKFKICKPIKASKYLGI